MNIDTHRPSDCLISILTICSHKNLQIVSFPYLKWYNLRLPLYDFLETAHIFFKWLPYYSPQKQHLYFIYMRDLVPISKPTQLVRLMDMINRQIVKYDCVCPNTVDIDMWSSIAMDAKVQPTAHFLLSSQAIKFQSIHKHMERNKPSECLIFKLKIYSHRPSDCLISILNIWPTDCLISMLNIYPHKTFRLSHLHIEHLFKQTSRLSHFHIEHSQKHW